MNDNKKLTAEKTLKKHLDKNGIEITKKFVGYLYQAMEEYASQFSQPNNIRAEEITDRDIELKIATSLLYATPEYRKGFEIGAMTFAKWVREKLTKNKA